MSSFVSRIQSQFQRRIGIDIGAGWVRFVLAAGSTSQDTPISEVSCLAIDQRTKRVLAVGSEAAVMKGRVGGQVSLQYPFQRGVVSDMESALALIKVGLQQLLPPKVVLNTVIMASLPASATIAERESTTQLMYALGAQEVYTIAQPLAAAIGAGVPIADASGSFLLHMGQSQVEGAVISLGSLVAHQRSDYAGQQLTEHIQTGVKKRHGLRIGDQAARDLLHTVASALPESKRSLLVTGQDVRTNGPKELPVTARDIQPEILKALDYYEALLQQLLTRVPPELTVDVIDKGLLLSGGLSQLEGVEQYLTQKMGVPVAVVDEPEKAVIRGIATVLHHLELFKQSLGYQLE